MDSNMPEVDTVLNDVLWCGAPPSLGSLARGVVYADVLDDATKSLILGTRRLCAKSKWCCLRFQVAVAETVLLPIAEVDTFAKEDATAAPQHSEAVDYWPKVPEQTADVLVAFSKRILLAVSGSQKLVTRTVSWPERPCEKPTGRPKVAYPWAAARASGHGITKTRT
ncbi:uncharacterized protein EI97DRAFT_438267 [Westerdykella ornata]|uniref:Uncharacterized protein n=1 Tax=Westerdykella ornata TaxID=318751 RepID=A0A6A6JW42_WESOR|nr:uncharacterized protein EI97DRAFT_438267 [Westerdykella ornata]KAF2280831.1 hypothetical protein EI97DRAFT_438267 [Westerdykella ornata]